LFLSYPIKRRFIAAAPLLGALDLSPYLNGIEHVTVFRHNGTIQKINPFKQSNIAKELGINI
jgi:hypothetical protein